MIRTEHDAEVEELLAARRETKRRAEQERHDLEYAQAVLALAALEDKEAREGPSADRHVASLGEVLRRAKMEFFAAAATRENELSDYHSKRMMLAETLGRTTPAVLRQAKADLEERIMTERVRDVQGHERRAVHSEHVRGLTDARDYLDQLIGAPADEMPARIERILAAVPPYHDGPVAEKESYTARMGRLLREGLNLKFNNN